MLVRLKTHILRLVYGTLAHGFYRHSLLEEACAILSVVVQDPLHALNTDTNSQIYNNTYRGLYWRL